MISFDHDYVEEAVARLKKLRADSPPAWGRMTSGEMLEHLADTVRYSMGRLGRLPDKSNWFLRNVIYPLLAHGIIRIPRNASGPVYPKYAQRGDLETLHAVLEEYLALVQAGELEPMPHPLFGPIGVDGWAVMHGLHFEHHMRQFGV
ncbi:MAG TPA: DUF1569 domain-containing protein [Candidatus Hydrogenedentes bacterium]|nr:DUF1569 domain-containing protein [Candidatus Hydrogenedentota bacterium]HOT50105.1 DUF1569 domain-containing protein [Candidatus Hydrogenedentota bacterium]HOV72831.1 DUF1569 domain-containing protein [Candidatus Hydrogenedentota bacterium]HPC16368.1 DUF1569 domain-containing protein [Candidatus Hydrogenedentota bacterium]HRT20301.1 DUF1569 domain-containing protein [Candidatus Hydrogenedentota bacterium]